MQIAFKKSEQIAFKKSEQNRAKSTFFKSGAKSMQIAFKKSEQIFHFKKVEQIAFKKSEQNRCHLDIPFISKRKRYICKNNNTQIIIFLLFGFCYTLQSGT